MKLVCPYCGNRAFAIYSRANEGGSFVRLGNYLDCPFDGMLWISSSDLFRFTGQSGAPGKGKPYDGYVRLLPDDARPASVPDRDLRKRRVR